MKYALLLFLLLTSCNYNRVKSAGEKPKTLDSNELSKLDLATELNYTSVNNKIISPQCLNCHSNATGNKGGLNLETYEAFRNKLNQIVYRSLEVQDMPPGGLAPEDKKLFQLWIECGAPTNNNGCSTGESAGPLNWNKIVKTVLSKSCLDCHNETAPDGNLNLAQYEKFKENYFAIFQRVFVKQDMPPKPYPSLTPNEKQAVLKWISQGMPR